MHMGCPWLLCTRVGKRHVSGVLPFSWGHNCGSTCVFLLSNEDPQSSPAPPKVPPPSMSSWLPMLFLSLLVATATAADVEPLLLEGWRVAISGPFGVLAATWCGEGGAPHRPLWGVSSCASDAQVGPPGILADPSRILSRPFRDLEPTLQGS